MQSLIKTKKDLKKYFSKYKYFEKIKFKLEKEKNKLEDKYTTLRATNFDEKIFSNFNNSKEKQLYKYLELLEKQDNKLLIIKIEQDKIKDLINYVDDIQREVLIDIYINFFSYSEISKKYNFCERYIYKLEDKALLDILDYLKVKKEDEILTIF